VTSTSLPPIRYRIGGLGSRMSKVPDLFACLLGDAADLDHDGTVVHLESVDVIGRCTTTDLV